MESEDDPMQMLMAVEKSISRDPGKIRVVQHRNNTMTEVPQLGVYILQEKQPEVLISPGRCDQIMAEQGIGGGSELA